MTRHAIRMAAVALAISLVSCDEPAQRAELPPPREVSSEAVGHYCGMLLAEHAGPKGQIFLSSREEPVWFSSVRDALAFTMLPEEPKDIRAIYVNDMSRAESWEQPGPGNWILAKDAWYVVGSRRKGGMGGDELVPFGGEHAARDFAAANGGRAIRFDDIAATDVLADGGGPAVPTPSEPAGGTADADAHRHPSGH